MQYYLRDGEEHQRVIFKEKEVRKYCYLLNKDFNYQVPTLMCVQSFGRNLKVIKICKETFNFKGDIC